jgi:low affinity Fe/Cu permease
MSRLFTRFAGWCAWALGHPLAFILACLATIAWAVSGPIFNYSDTWQLVINTGTTGLRATAFAESRLDGDSGEARRIDPGERGV